MKSLKYIFFILLFVLNIKVSLAQEDVLDSTVKNLLQEKITDKRIIIEPEYNSKSKVQQIKSQADKINSIILENFEQKSFSFRIRIYYNDGKEDMLSGHYASFIEIPVASRYIKFGEVIQASDLTSFKIKLENMKNGYITEDSEVIGMQAKKYIPVGTMIKAIDLVRPPVIKNNDPVNIVYISGVIDLKTSGIAVGSGAVGDMIKVKNATTGTILLGQIINKNTVQVGNNE